MAFSIYKTVKHWESSQQLIYNQRYGVIETSAGKLTAIHFRPLPKLFAWPEIWPVGADYHARGLADRCLLYYNQPWSSPNYLALKYVVTTAGTPYKTFCAALSILDAVAQLKGTDAILCDVSNSRLSDRFLARHGWQPHKPQRWHRNFIKRFYGEYPAIQVPLSASTASS